MARSNSTGRDLIRLIQLPYLQQYEGEPGADGMQPYYYLEDLKEIIMSNGSASYQTPPPLEKMTERALGQPLHASWNLQSSDFSSRWSKNLIKSSNPFPSRR